MSRDPRIDAYIERQADFARPILEHIRTLMHAACPEVEEAIKWGMPAFLYNGKQLAGMAAFKAHATLGFWQRSEVRAEGAKDGAMGDFGRLATIADLPDEARLTQMVHEAMALVDAGAKTVRTKTAKPELAMPDDLAAALSASPAAQATYDGFPPSCRREYLEWVIEAKRPETRARRVVQAVAQMAEGKKRNWKYEAC
ncbi:MAG TPA: YdeI/OmpD-associated family protein [Allosphingosinicella sp.]